jgi:hypothetical protein
MRYPHRAVTKSCRPELAFADEVADRDAVEAQKRGHFIDRIRGLDWRKLRKA